MADAKEEEPEERECRICRGEGEENNPLYVPCDCRGSIRYCHEDCLVRWLDHSGKDRCELCGVEFAFAPVYAEGAPDRLPMSQLISAGLQYVYSSLLPLVLRICASTLLWLGVAPLATCMLYRAWIHRPSELPVAWSGARLLEELASGLVVVAAIVVSFLSLFSFTDYMRVRWRSWTSSATDDEDHARNDAPSGARRRTPPPLWMTRRTRTMRSSCTSRMNCWVSEGHWSTPPKRLVARRVQRRVLGCSPSRRSPLVEPFREGFTVLGHASDLDVVNATQVDPPRRGLASGQIRGVGFECDRERESRTDKAWELLAAAEARAAPELVSELRPFADKTAARSVMPCRRRRCG